MNAALPGMLRDIGYPIRLVREAEKLLPEAVTERRGFKIYKNTAMTPQPVQVFQIDL
jgi:hypothetical protein